MKKSLCSALALVWLCTTACASEGVDTEGGELGDQPQLAEHTQGLMAVPPGTRRSIHALSAAERTRLRDAILAFITQPILDEHASAHDWHHPAVGSLFFSRHHTYLNKLEAYLKDNDHQEFVPLPEWDPGTRIPDEFLVADPLVSQAAMNANPNRPLPANLANVCTFASADDLARTVESWHDGVHGAVGGPMGSISHAPGAPIFWLWHGFLDDMYHEHQLCRCTPAQDALCDEHGAVCDTQLSVTGRQHNLCRWEGSNADSAAECHHLATGIWTTAGDGFDQGWPGSVPPGAAGACITQVNNLSCSTADRELCLSVGALCERSVSVTGHRHDLCRWAPAFTEARCSNTRGIWTVLGDGFDQSWPGALRDGETGACITQVANLR